MIKADSGILLLRDDEAEKLAPAAAFGTALQNTAKFKIGAGIIGGIVASGNAEIVNEVHSDARTITEERAFSSMICAPLKINDQVKGVIVLMNTTPVAYTAAELKLLVAIASQVAMGIENALLHIKLVKEATRKIELQRQELERAVQERTAEIKAAQQQLIQQEKLASLGQLTAGIAHEIKNPLNFVNNFSQLLGRLAKSVAQEICAEQEKLGEEKAASLSEDLEKIEQLSEKITEHGRRADSIVKSMMEHARTGKAERRSTDINALLDESVNLVISGLRARQPDFSITCQKNFDTSLPPISVIAQDVSRVFLNIISNACYATATRRRGIEMDGSPNQAGAVYEPTIWLTTKLMANGVEIRIRDNGTGIPASILDKIFEPFFTTKPAGEGTGLGLSIGYDTIVKGHNGELRVSSQEGEYSEFVVCLPV